MSERGTVAVIGGGMAGMGAAWELKKAGFEPTVFEGRDRVGGRIWTVRRGDFLMDAGTAVYLGTYRDAIDLIHEVGLGDEFCVRTAIGAMPRDGKLHHFDYTSGSAPRSGRRRSPGEASSGVEARRAHLQDPQEPGLRHLRPAGRARYRDHRRVRPPRAGPGARRLLRGPAG